MDSRKFRRLCEGRLSPALLSAATLVAWLLPISAAAASELRPSEVWCMLPKNRGSVVHTAEIEGLGSARGKGGLYLPAGSDGPDLTAEEWRRQRPKEFAGVCDRTYRGLTGNPVEEDSGSGEDDLSEGEEFLIAAGSGGLVAVLGTAGGYQVTRLSRRNERKYLRAYALVEALASLDGALEGLPEEIFEGTVSPGQLTEAARRARELQARIPMHPRSAAQKADGTVCEVLPLLDASGKGDARRKESLEDARRNLNRDVGELIKQINKDARVARWEK